MDIVRPLNKDSKDDGRKNSRKELEKAVAKQEKQKRDVEAAARREKRKG